MRNQYHVSSGIIDHISSLPSHNLKKTGIPLKWCCMIEFKHWLPHHIVFDWRSSQLFLAFQLSQKNPSIYCKWYSWVDISQGTDRMLTPNCHEGSSWSTYSSYQYKMTLVVSNYFLWILSWGTLQIQLLKLYIKSLWFYDVLLHWWNPIVPASLWISLKIS